MLPVISVVGKSNVGKTTLIRHLVGEFEQRGFRVAVVKHSTESVDLDVKGKDTYSFWEAGASAVVFSGPREMTLARRINREYSLEEITGIVGENIDIILTEGFREQAIHKVEISENGTEKNTITFEGQFFADGENVKETARRLADAIVGKYLG